MSYLSLLMAAASAHAEHKLLVTDLLDVGQVEAEAGFSYTHGSHKYDLTAGGVGVKHTADSFESGYSLGVGVGHDLQFSANVPYVFRQDDRYEANQSVAHHKRDGWRDVACSVKYRLIGDEKKSFTVVTGLSVKLDTAKTSEFGSGSINYNPFIAASTVIDNGATRPFVEYSATLRKDRLADTHAIVLGAEYEVNKAITLRPQFEFELNTNSDNVTDNELCKLSLESYVQVSKNLYVLPHLNVGYGSPYKSRSGGLDVGTTIGYGGGVGLYYLFNL